LRRILVTGASGLIGSALVPLLASRGHRVTATDRTFPADDPRHLDVRSPRQVSAALRSVDGIVHLAAVSRVVWGEKNPRECWRTNVTALRHLLSAALDAPTKPWVLFASSREVYGDAPHLPAREDTPFAPLNVYGRAKVAGESLIEEARAAGLTAGTVRLSNVYGRIDDHADRVVPAFCRGAARASVLRVEGETNTFDFTHVDDAVRGILLMTERLARGEPDLPPIHLVTGRGTTLGELAAMAVNASPHSATAYLAPHRTFDVARFIGDPTRAAEVLGWKAEISVLQGVRRLVRAFSALGRVTPRPALSDRKPC